MKKTQRFWIALWRSDCRLDGHVEHPLADGPGLGAALFETREKARNYIKRRYDYLKDRPDLRAEPHGWKMPKAVRATVTVEW